MGWYGRFAELFGGWSVAGWEEGLLPVRVFVLEFGEEGRGGLGRAMERLFPLLEFVSVVHVLDRRVCSLALYLNEFVVDEFVYDAIMAVYLIPRFNQRLHILPHL